METQSLVSKSNKRRVYDDLVVQPAVIYESGLDFNVTINRFIRPIYPFWMKKVKHPKLEFAGPTKYNLQTQVEQWLHDDQKNGLVSGEIIFKHLIHTKTLRLCLNLQDGLAIQQKGIAVFQKLFKSNAVFLWGSVAQDHEDYLRVPYLLENRGEIVLLWYFLHYYWDFSHLALRFNFK